MPATNGYRPTPIPSARDDIEATWEYIQNNVNKIMVNLEGGMTMQDYMGTYTCIHDFCTSQKANTNRDAYPGPAHRGAHLLGEELYKKLANYLCRYLTKFYNEAVQQSGENLLGFYIKEWDRFTIAAKYIHHFFHYLNRHWVKREIDEGKRNIYDVYTLHLVEWKSNVFDLIAGKVMDAVMKLVERQRNGETIEYMQIRQIIDSMVSLGLDENDSTKTTLDTYRYHFEKRFIDDTRRYYQDESSEFVAKYSVVEYMKKAEARLAEEDQRVATYLLPDITVHLKRCCNQALIENHANLIRDEFQQLLDNQREEDLSRMYGLLSRVSEGLDPLRSRFETHVRNAGLAAVAKVAADAEKLDPKVYVDALLETHTTYRDLVKTAFNDEAEFTRALDNACREFVNRNDVSQGASNKSPELLAKYTDFLLKKSGTGEEADLEASLSQIMTVFKYIEDKDVFQKFYSRMLARRLVSTNTSSEDAETSMISKLKEECGFEYTNRLQRMFQDMQISRDLNAGFKEHVQSSETTALDGQYSILGTGFWPLSPPTTTFTRPAEMQNDCDKFTRFYKQKHEGRKLTWLWQLCKGELKTTYCKNSRTPYTFQVSAYQMAILLLFNDKDKYTYEEIVSATNLNAEALDPSLAIIVKARVLSMTPAGGDKVGPGKTFSLNYDFRNKKIRINLNIGMKSEQRQEEAETNKTIEEDRKLLLQSAIVRIMKARKHMKHNQLVSETIAQIKSRFIPKVADIKKCIEILLDKEYIERLDDDELGYLA